MAPEHKIAHIRNIKIEKQGLNLHR
jgi:hypothetical protein